MTLRNLPTYEAVLKALDGPRGVARITNRTYKTSFNDKYRGKFPAKKRDVMLQALNGLGFTAPGHLWGQE